MECEAVEGGNVDSADCHIGVKERRQLFFGHGRDSALHHIQRKPDINERGHKYRQNYYCDGQESEYVVYVLQSVNLWTVRGSPLA